MANGKDASPEQSSVDLNTVILGQKFPNSSRIEISEIYICSGKSKTEKYGGCFFVVQSSGAAGDEIETFEL